MLRQRLIDQSLLGRGPGKRVGGWWWGNQHVRYHWAGLRVGNWAGSGRTHQLLPAWLEGCSGVGGGQEGFPGTPGCMWAQTLRAARENSWAKRLALGSQGTEAAATVGTWGLLSVGTQAQPTLRFRVGRSGSVTPGCVALGKSLSLSEPRFPLPCTGKNRTPS